MRLLLVHHTGYHFDTLLAAREALKARHEVDIWSNTLDRFGRRALAERIGLRFYDPAADYDGLVLITADAGAGVAAPDGEVAGLLRRRPVVRLMHRFSGVREPGTLHLFGGAPLPFIPVGCGVPVGSSARRAGGRRTLLVQGNIEPRRGYAVLPRLAAAVPEVSINVVGRTTGHAVGGLDGLHLHTDLDEIDFHRACAANDFLAPLLDPTGFPHYFSDRFTSAVMISFAYGIPVIAHRDLFALYPLEGLRYDDEAGFLDCVAAACAMDRAAIGRMAADTAIAAAALHARNQDHFDIALAEAGAKP